MSAHEGITLDRYLQAKGHMSPAQAVNVTLEVVRQMVARRDFGVVHPGRIAIGKDRRVSLLEETEVLPAAVEHPAYAAPEAIRGNGRSERAAAYSLGCTLFELLAGRPPFTSSDAKETLKAHLEKPAPSLAGMVPGLPARLTRTVAGLLSKSPDERCGLAELQSLLGEVVRRKDRGAQVPAAAAPPTQATGAVAGRPARARARSPGTRSAGTRSAAAVSDSGALPGTTRRRSQSGVSSSAKRKRGLTAGRPSAESSRLTKTTRLRSRRRTPGLMQDDLAEGEHRRAIPRRPRTYPFTIAGALLGLLIGVVLVTRGAERVREQPQQLAEQTQREIEAERGRRKAAYMAQYQQRSNAVERLLRQVKGLSSAELRYDALVKGMDVHLSSPQATRLAAAVFAAFGEKERFQGDAAASGSKTEDPGYARIKTLAQTLEGQGLLGDAIIKMADAYQDYRNVHREEIDSFIERVSNQLTARWEADHKAIERHFEKSDVGAAVKLLEQARDYGDSTIRKVVEAYLDRVRELQIVQAGAGSAGAEKERDGEESAVSDDVAADDWGDEGDKGGEGVEEDDDWGDWDDEDSGDEGAGDEGDEGDEGDDEDDDWDDWDDEE